MTQRKMSVANTERKPLPSRSPFVSQGLPHVITGKNLENDEQLFST